MRESISSTMVPVLRKNLAWVMETRVYVRQKSFHNINVNSRGKFVPLFFPFHNDQATIGCVRSVPRLPHQETELIRGVISIHIYVLLLFVS